MWRRTPLRLHLRRWRWSEAGDRRFAAWPIADKLGSIPWPSERCTAPRTPCTLPCVGLVHWTLFSLSTRTSTFSSGVRCQRFLSPLLSFSLRSHVSSDGEQPDIQAEKVGPTFAVGWHSKPIRDLLRLRQWVAHKFLNNGLVTQIGHFFSSPFSVSFFWFMAWLIVGLKLKSWCKVTVTRVKNISTFFWPPKAFLCSF